MRRHHRSAHARPMTTTTQTTTAQHIESVERLSGGRIRALAPHSQLRGDREYLAIFSAADERGEAC